MKRQEQTRYKVLALFLFFSGLVYFIPFYQKLFNMYTYVYKYPELVACFISMAMVNVIIALLDMGIKMFFPKLWSVMNNAQQRP